MKINPYSKVFLLYKPYFGFCCLLFLFLAASLQLSAQVNDAQLWTSFSVEKKLTPRLSASLETEARFVENMGETGKTTSSLSFSYKSSKMIRFAVSYRFSSKESIDGLSMFRNRFAADVTLRYKKNWLVIQNRTRLQSQFHSQELTENRNNPELYLREKISLKIDLDRKITPIAGSEIYYSLNMPRGNQITRVRLFAGADYAIHKKLTTGFQYTVQQEIGANNAKRFFITALHINWLIY